MIVFAIKTKNIYTLFSNKIYKSRFETMGEKVNIDSMTVAYEGFYDMEAIFKSIYKWLTIRKFTVYETKYKNKLPEYEISWVAARLQTTELKYVLNLTYHIWGESKVDIKKDSGISKMESGRMTILIKPYLELFPDDTYGDAKWEQTPMLLKLKEFATKSLLKKRIDEVYKLELRKDEIHLQEHIKSLLKIDAVKGAY